MEHNLQQTLFSRIKETIPPQSSLVDEVSEILSVSTDSAYRRIRGEKPLAIDEVKKLCAHFKIPFDSLSGNSSDGILFKYVGLEENGFNKEQYLNSIIGDLQMIAGSEDKEIIYMCKDIPLMQLFQVPEIAAFKTFFWEKSIAGIASFDNQKFNLKEQTEAIKPIAGKIITSYLKIPTSDIWSEETIVSLLYQIRYYRESGYFENKDDASKLCDKVNELVYHVSEQARMGFKFVNGGSAAGEEGNYKLYFNDLVLPDNTILVRVGKTKKVYLSHNVMNYLTTPNIDFCEKTHQTLNNLVKRSVLISSVSERERNRFFQKIEERIARLKDSFINS